MATVLEVKSFLRKNLRIEELDGTGIMKVHWELESGRTQVVLIDFTEKFMRILSPFAEEGKINVERALDVNEQVWGISKVLGLYSLTHVVLLENADPNEIMEPLLVVAAAADEVERKLGLGDRF